MATFRRVMGRDDGVIGVSFQAVSRVQLDLTDCQLREFDNGCHHGEFPVRFASFVILLLIPVFSFAQMSARPISYEHVAGGLERVSTSILEKEVGLRICLDSKGTLGGGTLGRVADFEGVGFASIETLKCSDNRHGSSLQHQYVNTVPDREVNSAHVHLRNGFANSWDTFARKKKGTVAFIGGSITEMNGYRLMVEQNLRRRFPDTDFTFVNAGISSTCSTAGAHRLGRDVLSKNPDLLFVEFAVNDDQDASHAERECRRGMEGILRRARFFNPAMDIVVTHFVNPPMLELLRQGKTPISSGAHEAVAAHYGVSTIDLAREVAERIDANELTWATYGGTHPKPAGNRIAADMIEQLLDAAWADEGELATGKQIKHKIAKPLDTASYSQGRLIAGTKAKFDKSWVWGIPAWNSIAGGKRGRFTKLEMLCAEVANAELSLDFDGQAVGLYVLAGPDAGRVEYSIDGGEFKTAELFHRFSKGLHYPRTVMLETGLERGAHHLTLRVANESDPQSKGNAVRILEFVTN